MCTMVILMSKRYLKNYLNEVIFQVRFSPLLSLYSIKPEAAAKFQEVVGDKFPDLQFNQKRNLKVKMDSTQNSIESNMEDEYLIWNFKSNDGKSILLSGEELTLSYPKGTYLTFEEFKEDVELVLKGLSQYKIPKINSIGLRYINQININNKSRLSDFINPKLHQLDKEFDSYEVLQSLSRIELKIEDYILAFQYGQFNPKYPELSSNKDFILDYDCVKLPKTICSIDYILNNLINMNKIIFNRFENDISDKLKKIMSDE